MTGRCPNTECPVCGEQYYRRPAEVTRGQRQYCSAACRRVLVVPLVLLCSVGGCFVRRHYGGMCAAHWAERGPRCSVDGCGVVEVAKGLCAKHHKRQRVAARDADPAVPRCRWADCGRAEAFHGYCDSHKHNALDLGIVGSPCVVDGCPASARGKGLCSRHWSRAKAYGMTPEELADAEAQVCAVCGSDQRQVVDHDHVTGAVRGVLCSWCNTAIGHAFDEPERLRAMAAYLERFEG